MAVEVEKPDERQLFGRSTKSGLFTPVRTALRLDQRFLIAYGYGELSGKVLVFNPGNAILRIRRGCEIAEFHPTNEIDVVTPESAAARKRDEADKARVKIEGSGRIVWQKQGQAQQSKLAQVEQAEAEVLQVEQAAQGKAVTQQFQHRMQRSKAQEEKVVQEEEKRLTLNNTQLKPLTNADLDELSEMEQYNLFLYHVAQDELDQAQRIRESAQRVRDTMAKREINAGLGEAKSMAGDAEEADMQRAIRESMESYTQLKEAERKQALEESVQVAAERVRKEPLIGDEEVKVACIKAAGGKTGTTSKCGTIWCAGCKCAT